MSRVCISKGKNRSDTVFALVSEGNEKYSVLKLCSNYDGKVRGDIRKTWRFVEKNITEEAARNLYERRLKGTQK